jgi:uncharacterized membrane protein
VSLEVGRKYGYYASIINVVLPIIGAIGFVAVIISVIAASASSYANGAVGTSIFTFGVGVVALIVGVVVLAIIGFILFMVAMHNLSNYYKEPVIFKNVLYAFILTIIEYVAAFLIYIAVVFTAFRTIDTTPNPSSVSPQPVLLVYVVFIVVWVGFGLINGVLYMRAFNKLKERSGVDNFGTAGILYLIGVIVPIIGWIAWIFAAMGFNKLTAAPTNPQYAPYAPQPPPMSYTMQTKRCPNCGAENTPDALYCQNCGKPT